MLLFIIIVKFVTPTSGLFFYQPTQRKLAFYPNIQLSEFRSRIRQKVGNLSHRISSLKYRYLVSNDPMKDEIFNVIGLMALDAMVQTHYATGPPILELYTQFIDIDEGGWKSKIVLVMPKRNKKLEVQPHGCAVGSQLCLKAYIMKSCNHTSLPKLPKLLKKSSQLIIL